MHQPFAARIRRATTGPLVVDLALASVPFEGTFVADLAAFEHRVAGILVGRDTCLATVGTQVILVVVDSLPWVAHIGFVLANLVVVFVDTLGLGHLVKDRSFDERHNSFDLQNLKEAGQDDLNGESHNHHLFGHDGSLHNKLRI